MFQGVEQNIFLQIDEPRMKLSPCKDVIYILSMDLPYQANCLCSSYNTDAILARAR